MNGFGLEFFMETPADEIGTSLTEIKKSWQFQLLYTVSQLAAGRGRRGSMAAVGSNELQGWQHSAAARAGCN